MLIIDSSIGEKIYSPNEWYKHYEPIFKVKKIRYKILGEYVVDFNIPNTTTKANTKHI